MKNFLTLFGALLLLWVIFEFLGGNFLSGNGLECDSSQAKELVVKIAQKQYFNPEQMSFTVEAIRSQGKNSAGATSCAAELHITYNGEVGKALRQAVGSNVTTLPITYKVEATTDNRMYVTVWGLH